MAIVYIYNLLYSGLSLATVATGPVYKKQVNKHTNYIAICKYLYIQNSLLLTIRS